MNPDFTNARPKAIAGITSAEFDGEVVAYSPKPGKGYHLNGTAAWLWEQCDGMRGVDELVARMREAFDCGTADVRADVERTLGELYASGLIELEPGLAG